MSALAMVEPEVDTVVRVEAALCSDTRTRSERIYVTGDKGEVVVQGVVSSYPIKLRAANIAAKAAGEVQVVDRITVREATFPADIEITNDVMTALRIDALTYEAKVFCVVDRGWVTLTGSVSGVDELAEVLRVAGSVHGVRGLINRVAVRP